MTRRILCVLEAGDVYPSGFIRSLIYADWFAGAGYDVRYISRLTPLLLRARESPPAWLWPLWGRGGASALWVLECGLARVRERAIVRMARKCDVVYMSKVMSYRLVRQLRQCTQARMVLDFGDALWLPTRRVNRFNEILGFVDAVTTDNELTAEYVRQFQPNCTVIPDCPQVEWFDRRRAARPRDNRDEIVIGWVGSAGTTYNLYLVWEALERVFARHPNLRLRLLGGNPMALPPFEQVKWSLQKRYTQPQLVDEVLGMDIGLFPLQDVAASRVRGVLKATVYMAGGACVVASPVGQCSEFIEHGRNGFLASTTQQWEEVLERLIADPALRGRVAERALAQVRRSFTVSESFEKLIHVLDPATSAKGVV